MPSRAQLLAIAEWDAWRYMAKPPRSEAELGISEQEIAAGWAQYLEEREVEARRNRQRACEGRARRRERRPWRSRRCSAVPRRAGGRRALGSPRAQLATPAPRGGAGFQAKQPAAAIVHDLYSATRPRRHGRALEDPSAVVKAELRVVFDALRCARPGSALVPGPLAAAEKLIPWLTGQPTQRCRADFVTDDGALAPVVNPGDAGLALPVVCDVRVDLWRGERNRFTRGDGDGT